MKYFFSSLLVIIFSNNLLYGQTVVDLLVAYTSEANSYSGGAQLTVDIIEQAIDDANTSFVNSSINVQYNLVRVGYLSYTEGGKTAEQIWADFSTNSTIANLRNEYNADLCFLAFGSSTATGYGEIPPFDNPTSSTSDIGFAVANISRVDKIYSLAHELGHNFGARHDIDEDGAGDYNHGYIAPNGSWGTIMSYVNNPEENRLNAWSNPNKYHLGIPMGNTDDANNALWLNEQKQDIANYRTPILSGTLTNNQTLSGRTFTLSGNITVPTGKTLKVLSSATIELNSYYVKSKGGTIIIEENGANNFAKLQSGSTIKALYPTIASAISNAMSGQTVLSYGNHTLSSNVLVPSGVTMIVKQNTTIDINDKYIKSTGGTIIVENGATGNFAMLKTGSTIKGLYTPQAAINASSSYQTIELLPNKTYSIDSGTITISSISNRTLKGDANGTSIIDGNITVTNSDYANISNLKMHNGHNITVNGGTDVNVSFIDYMSSSTAVSLYGGTSNDMGGINVNSSSTSPAIYYYNTSGDVRGIEISGYDFAVWATSNASINVSMNSMFCDNMLDLYANSGGYIYASNNTMSAPWPQSIGGNVSGYSSYVCSKQLSKSNLLADGIEDNPLPEEINLLNAEYAELLKRITDENEDKSPSVLLGYKPEFDALIKDYKALLTVNSSPIETTAILSKIEKCYYATESQNEFEAYINTLLREKSSPYIERYFVNLNLNNEKYKEAIEVCEKVLSSKEINEPLTCDALRGSTYL